MELLPTADAAENVERLTASALTLKADAPEQVKLAQQIEGRITSFVLRQLTVAPGISSAQLTSEVRRILKQCPPDDDASCDIPGAARITGGGEGQVVLTYTLWPHLRLATTVIESYSLAKGHAVLGARETVLPGYDTDAEIVARYSKPAEEWVIVWGKAVGSSGLAPAGRAVLYKVGTASIDLVWEKEDLPYLSVHAHADDHRWEMSYADAERYGKKQRGFLILEIYSLDYKLQTVSEIAHVHYQ